MNDNFHFKTLAPPITDFRSDHDSCAIDFIVKDEEGFYITNAHPPKSIAAHQNDLRGWRPDKFFDEENEAKHIQGVSGPLPDTQHIVRGQLEAELRQALVKYKSQAKARTFEPML